MKKPIRILFDANPLVSPNLTGVGRTTKGLITALASEFPDEIILTGHYFNFLGKHPAANLPSIQNIQYRQTRVLPRKVYNMARRLGIPIPFELLVKKRGDFILFPDFLGWPSLFDTPSAPFIHDITYLVFPDYVSRVNLYDLKKLIPKTLRRAEFIITNSESSKKGIQKSYNVTGDKFLVENIPLVDACDIAKDEAKRRLHNLGITKKYLLFLGTLEPRKNLVGLLSAYGSLPDTLSDSYELVISGGKGWNDTEILRKINELKSSGKRIIQTGYVSNEDRAALFIGATMYVMPSHYEGFGMQALEAMYYSTPMLLSDIPVLHEVAQDCALYCGTEPKSIAEGIEKMLGSESKRKKLAKNGQIRLKQFSWKKVAKEIFSRIEKK